MSSEQERESQEVMVLALAEVFNFPVELHHTLDGVLIASVMGDNCDIHIKSDIRNIDFKQEYTIKDMWDDKTEYFYLKYDGVSDAGGILADYLDELNKH